MVQTPVRSRFPLQIPSPGGEHARPMPAGVLSELDVLRAMAVDIRHMHDILCVTPDDAIVLAYPSNGDMRAMPPGEITIDFMAGLVIRPDQQENIQGSLAGAPDTSIAREMGRYIRSVNLFADTDVNVALFAGSDGRTSGKFQLRQATYASLASIAAQQIKITSAQPYNLQVIGSTLPFPVAGMQGADAFQERYGTLTTSDAFQQVTFSPTKGGILAAQYRTNTIFTGHIGTKIFTVQNNGATGVNINLQLLLNDAAGVAAVWADDPVTGSALALGAGNIALIETGIPTQFIRLRLQNQTPGSAGNAVTAAYFGTTTIR